MVRLDASRTQAKASGRMSSSVSPPAKRFLKSCVLARSCSSERELSSDSNALIDSTTGSSFFKTRSFRVPPIILEIKSSIEVVMLQNAERHSFCGCFGSVGFQYDRCERSFNSGHFRGQKRSGQKALMALFQPLGLVPARFRFEP